LVSVIIPTYQERERLPGCLDGLLPEAARAGAEVLVVDGGSTDGTAALARGRAGLRVLTAPRGRGRQMNAGARAARGSLLLFLPADTALPAGALERLGAIDRAGQPLAGGFRQRFDRDRRALRVVSLLHNLRARLSGVSYGDQAPFVRREMFLELGGYREDQPMEDLEFGARLARRTRPRQLELEVVTSARRFDRSGDLRATLEAARLLLLWVLGRRSPKSRIFFDPVR